MADMEDASFKILYEAHDETFLIHVSGPSFINGEPDQPGMSIEVLCPALRKLLNDGLIQMYEATGDDRELTLAEALAVIDQDTHWIAPGDDEEPMMLIYGLLTTPAGDEHLWPEWETRNGKRR